MKQINENKINTSTLPGVFLFPRPPPGGRGSSSFLFFSPLCGVFLLKSAKRKYKIPGFMWGHDDRAKRVLKSFFTQLYLGCFFSFPARRTGGRVLFLLFFFSPLHEVKNKMKNFFCITFTWGFIYQMKNGFKIIFAPALHEV